VNNLVNRRFITITALWVAFAFVPSFAQEEEPDPFEEEFGDEFLDEEGFLEEEDFPLEGDEFGDEEFLDVEGFDEEGLAGFDDFEASPLDDDFEGDTRRGYTITVSGGMPTFRNSMLLPWLGVPNGRVGVDLPFYLSLGPIGFRVGAEVGTYDFTYDETGLIIESKDVLPLNGKFGGIGFFGVVTIPSGPANLRLGMGMLGTSPAYMAVQSIGVALGDMMDLRLGVRATAAYNVPDGLTTTGTHMSWVDAFMALGLTF
tara:strand:- start:1909 stop:2682 length:774 start_codon:yes stop_codon:yes gene_type:complete